MDRREPIASMRVALVTYGFLMGGVEKFLFLMADGLREAGVDVTYVVTDTIGPWHERATQRGVRAIAVLPSRWRSARHHAMRLGQVLKDFDAVLVNHCAAVQPIIGQLPASCLVATILHNDHDRVYRVGLSNLARSDYIVAVGSKIAREAARRGTPPDKLVRIPHGVDVPIAYPKTRRPPDGPPLKLIFVGRIDHEQKGVFDLPQVILGAQQLGARITLDIVGEGPDATALREKFEADLPGFPVVFHGRQSNEETLRLMGEADVMLMPSRYEGFPVALVEALALGVVPIASHLPGMTDDAVTAGVNGFLPPVGDIEGFARAIVRLQDDDLLQTMSHAAWDTARDQFTRDVMTSCYLQLLNGPRPQRDTPGDAPDLVGRQLFGRGWFFPMGLVEAVRSVRRQVKLPARRGPADAALSPHMERA
jgi:glycosyltransferase involved in cell wall biosynthesis